MGKERMCTMPDLTKSARTVLVDCLGAKKAENVLIVVDEPLRDIGQALLIQGRELETEAVLLEMLPRQSNGEEPPPMVAKAMLEAQVIILATSKSLSHTRARKEANRRGARVASMPGLTAPVMARTLSGGYGELEARCRKYARFLTEAAQVRLTTPAGTDLTFSLQGREAFADSGMLQAPGSFGNLPAGEAFIAPLEGTAAGTLVVDGSMAGIGLIQSPIVMKVEKGLVVEIEGGQEADRLKELVDRFGPAARNIAELGIGLNDQAVLSGIVLEDEKVLGTVHVALGDNSTIGGTVEVPSHLDGVLLQPSLWLDGRKILEKGNLLA
jgi:leucyl aminopeptidase (aminopeptidase T)